MKGQEKLQHIVKHMGGGGGNKQGLEGSMWRKKKNQRESYVSSGLKTACRKLHKYREKLQISILSHPNLDI